MFNGLLSTSSSQNRAARRLTTVISGARRSRNRHMRETVRQSTQRLSRLQERQQQQHQHRHQHTAASHHRSRGASLAMQAEWTAAQHDALAQEEAAWRASSPMPDTVSSEDASTTDPHAGRQPSSSSPLHYDDVDADTGDSVVQQNFNDLVHRALLHYGPPLPVEVVMQNNIISAASLSPDQQRAQRSSSSSNNSLSDKSDGGADDPNAVYMDEVGLKLHELMRILRKERPHFSVRDDCDGVPLSLLVRNCNYLRAYGGKVNYMRFVRRLPRSVTDNGEEAESADTMVLSLGKYKMRELPSQDGIRQGPQPWRYSYRTL